MPKSPNSPTNPKRIEFTHGEIERMYRTTWHSGVRHATGVIMFTGKPAVFCKNGNWFLLVGVNPPRTYAELTRLNRKARQDLMNGD